jgi:hypothetical protein
MLAYCDYIANRIHHLVSNEINDNDTLRHPIMASIGNPKMDLHPEDGYFMSTKKTIEITDKAGKVYIVTIEEKT